MRVETEQAARGNKNMSPRSHGSSAERSVERTVNVARSQES